LIKAIDIRKKSVTELNDMLLLLYRSRFKLMLEKTSGAEFNKHSKLGKVKKDIAIVLTVIKELYGK